MDYEIPELPFSVDLNTSAILVKLISTHRALAELKGIANSIPNPTVLMSTLALQEARKSSEIENLVTTQDDLYRATIDSPIFHSREAKEVHRYATSLLAGDQAMRESGLLTMKLIEKIQIQTLENTAGFRRQGGTVLKDDRTGSVVYTPPQTQEDIQRLLSNLEHFINDPEMSQWDPLIKMAVVHHQFESIHPFYDGNGRTGRMLNVLYLVYLGLLDQPILYHSRYINQNKPIYYDLLQRVRISEDWEPWILFMLDAVETTSKETTRLILEIRKLMQETKVQLRRETRFYSQDLINTLFKHPYTKINFFAGEMGISAVTARNQLEQLVSIGILSKVRIGRPNYYVNDALVRLFASVD